MTDVIDKKQKLLIEHMIADRALLSKCIRILKPAYFEKPLDRVVGFIVEYFHNYHSCPSVDVIEAETTLALKERDVEPHEEEYVLEEIENFCKDAAMTDAILKSADLIHEGDKSQIQELVREALMVKIDNSIGLSLFDDPYTRITMMEQAVDERKTGLDPLDNMIGNIRRGELGIFYAVSSGGKSVMLAGMANLLAQQDLDVAIVTLELNQELYSKRLDSIVTGTDIAQHTASAKEINDALLAMKSNMGNITTKKMRGGSTVADLRSYLTEYHLVHGKYPDVMLVDYLTLMKPIDKRLSGKSEEHESIAIDLRDLMDEFQMYGMTAGQVNREGQDVANLGPHHVAGGISVVNTVDWAVYMTATEEDIDNNQVQLGQLKIRNSDKTSSSVTLYRCPKTLRFSDSPVSGKAVKQSPLTQSKPKQQTSQPTQQPKKSKPKPEQPSASDLTNNTGKAKLSAALKLRR